MRSNGISATNKKKFKVTTNSSHNYPVSLNLLEQDFSTYQPEKVLVSDLTYIFTQEDWLYLTVIIDLYNRMIVGWAMSKSLGSVRKQRYQHSNRPAAALILLTD